MTFKILTAGRIYLLFFLLSGVIGNSKGQTIQMIKEAGVYKVPCYINGIPLAFVLDTGASHITISLTEASFMLKNGYLKDTDFKEIERYKIANGEIASGSKIILKSVQIGEIKLSNIEAVVMHNLNSPLLLGISTLEKIGQFELDYSHGLLKIKQNSVNSDHIDTEHPASYLNKGLTKIRLESWSDAISDFNITLQKDARNSLAYHYRGICKNHLKDFYGAISDYDIAINLEPRNNSYYISRGISKLSLDNYNEAILDYDRALELDPNDSESYSSRGLAKSLLGMYREAIFDYDKAIELNPSLASAYYLRGLSKVSLYKKDSRENDSCFDWEKASKLGNSKAQEMLILHCK